MAGNEAVLYTRMELRLADAEKKLAKFQTNVDRNMTGIERSSKRAARTMETSFASSAAKIGGVFKSFGTGLVAGVAAGGLAGIVGTLRGVASSVAEIGAEAQRAGLSTKAFQELKFVAEQNRVSVDALTDGMKELSLRTDEFIVSGGKTGSAAEAFQRLGYTVDELKTKIKDPSALLSEIIGKVQSLDKAAQVGIFDELFGGTGGEQFVRLIGQGEKGIRDTVKAANDLGAVLSEDVIKRAAEVDAKFNAIATTVGTTLKGAIVDAFSVLADFVDQYRDIQNQANSTIDKQIADLGRERLDVETKILEAKEQQRELDRAGMLNPLSQAVGGVDLQQYQRQLDAIAEKERALVDERAKRNELAPIVIPTTSGSTYSGGQAPSTSGGSPRADDYARAVESIRQHTEALRAETAAQAALNPLIDDYGFAVEKARAQQDLLTAAKEAGKTVTPQLAAEIDKLATAYANSVVEAGKLAETQDEVRQRAEEAGEFNKDLTRGIVDGFVEGRKAADIFADSLKKVGDRLLDMAFDGLFPSTGSGGTGLFGAIGGLLGIGKREHGGPVSAGRPYIVGEKRPEIFVPNQSGVILPKVPTKGGGGLTVSATYAPTINAPGATPDAVAALAKAQDRDRRDFKRNVIAAVQEAQKRNINV